jgi:16S rRNA (guanine527-N7)-methyltransferase
MNTEALFTEFQNYVTRNIVPFVSKELLVKFRIYFNKLAEWNSVLNLVSYKDEATLVYRHFCDSLYSAKVMHDILSEKIKNHNIVSAANSTFISSSTPKLAGVVSHPKVADLGSGSGMPGIPVKIVLPNIRLTLVESVTKKCAFLENVNNSLELHIKILNERAEAIGQMPFYRQHYDFVLSRAVCRFSPNLEISIPLLKVGGYFIVHKTLKSVENLQEGLLTVKTALRCLGAKLEKIIPYTLPQQKLHYCIVVFKKYKNTPKRFPRKIGIPEKKPL